MKLWIGRVLLVFAIFTLGYGLGQDRGRRQAAHASQAPPAPTLAPATAAATAAPQVRVYYLHTTYRCETCTTIEQLARELVQTRFAAAVARGQVSWQAIDFQKDETLAKRYEVAASGLVIVRVVAGQEVAYQRLEDAWTLYDKPTQFAEYVGGAIQAYLLEAAP